MAFLLCLPIIQCTLFDLSIGRDPLGLKVGLVNEELLNEGIDCKMLPNVTCSSDYPASCRYMAALEKKKMKLVSKIKLQNKLTYYSEKASDIEKL